MSKGAHILANDLSAQVDLKVLVFINTKPNTL